MDGAGFRRRDFAVTLYRRVHATEGYLHAVLCRQGSDIERPHLPACCGGGTCGTLGRVTTDVSNADGANRRRWPRGARDEVLIIKIIASTDPTMKPGRTLMARAADISARGMRLRIRRDVVAGTVIEMWIISPLHQGTLVLTGTVRWCRPKTEDDYTHEMGVEISQAPKTDFVKWAEMVNDLLPPAAD